MERLDLVEIPREPRNGVGDAQKRQGEHVALALVGLERAGAAIDNRAGQELRIAKCVSDPVRGKRILEIAGITHERPARSMAFPQEAWRSTKTAQAANKRAAFDIGAQPRAARFQDLEKPAPDIAAKCREELRSWHRGKDAMTRIRRDHSRRDIPREIPMGAIPRQSVKVAKDNAAGIAGFKVGSGVDKPCNGGLPAVSPDDHIGADGGACPAGIRQRDADNPAAGCAFQLAKSDTMTNFDAEFAGRINQ